MSALPNRWAPSRNALVRGRRRIATTGMKRTSGTVQPSYEELLAMVQAAPGMGRAACAALAIRSSALTSALPLGRCCVARTGSSTSQGFPIRLQIGNGAMLTAVSSNTSYATSAIASVVGSSRWRSPRSNRPSRRRCRVDAYRAPGCRTQVRLPCRSGLQSDSGIASRHFQR
jgi:hypothetical protein